MRKKSKFPEGKKLENFRKFQGRVMEKSTGNPEKDVYKNSQNEKKKSSIFQVSQSVSQSILRGLLKSLFFSLKVLES